MLWSPDSTTNNCNLLVKKTLLIVYLKAALVHLPRFDLDLAKVVDTAFNSQP